MGSGRPESRQQPAPAPGAALGFLRFAGGGYPSCRCGMTVRSFCVSRMRLKKQYDISFTAEVVATSLMLGGCNLFDSLIPVFDIFLLSKSVAMLRPKGDADSKGLDFLGDVAVDSLMLMEVGRLPDGCHWYCSETKHNATKT